MRKYIIVFLLFNSEFLAAQIPELNFLSKYSIGFSPEKKFEIGIGTAYGLNPKNPHDIYLRRGVLMESLISVNSGEVLLGMTIGAVPLIGQSYYISFLDPWKDFHLFKSKEIYFGYGMEFVFYGFMFRITSYRSEFYSLSFGFCI